jgi:hypothetical protein
LTISTAQTSNTIRWTPSRHTNALYLSGCAL